ncbi:hypothetical protein AGMMS49944_00220 [Spirochaetia bacterium]|nr:hypothetical protein AGMMS49944_00220 [Spirochaetia bacterium]
MKRTLTWFLLILLCGTAFAGGGKDASGTGKSTGKADGLTEEHPAELDAAARNRGQGIRLAVLAPDGQNFAEADRYLAAFTQGRLNDTFSRYSAMTIIDRQNLDTLLNEQERAANGAYSNEDFVKIGGLTNAQYILAGTIIKLSAAEFSVQLGITNTETGERRTSFTKNCSAADLRQGKVINDAAVELLTGIGVELTAAEKQAILSGQAGSTEAETALARGIAAQKNGNRIEAMTYMYQAASFDPSMSEATGRLNTLAAAMTGGNIGEAVQSDYQARMTWLDLFKECAAFYQDHPPFEILYDPDLTQGDIDFAKSTVDLSFRIALVPSDSGFKVLNDLLGRLEQTGNRSKWGFAGWPLLDVQPREPAAVVFGGKLLFTFKVDAAIVNGDGKTIATGSVVLNSKNISFSSGDQRVTAPADTMVVFKFPNVNANDLTENIIIKIAKINDMDAGTVGERGYIRILTQAEHDALPEEAAKRLAAVEMANRLAEQQAAKEARQAEQRAEENRRAEERQKEEARQLRKAEAAARRQAHQSAWRALSKHLVISGEVGLNGLGSGEPGVNAALGLGFELSKFELSNWYIDSRISWEWEKQVFEAGSLDLGTGYIVRFNDGISGNNAWLIGLWSIGVRGKMAGLIGSSDDSIYMVPALETKLILALFTIGYRAEMGFDGFNDGYFSRRAASAGTGSFHIINYLTVGIDIAINISQRK